MRFIEVVATARVEREIENYETTLELSTSAGRKVTCFDRALELRNAVVEALKKSGLSNSDLREGGGEASLNYWSTTKSVVHRIAIRNKNMDLIMSAMAAVERHFSSLPSSFFGRRRQNFTFHAPTPIYAVSASAEDALGKAMENARNTAAVIASASGFRLGPMIFVAEQDLQRRNDAYATPSYNRAELESIDACLSELEAPDTVAYSGLPANSASAARRFRVRFATEDAKPSGAPTPPIE